MFESKSGKRLMTSLRRKDCFLDSRLSRDGGLMYVVHDFTPFNRAAVGTSCAFHWDRGTARGGAFRKSKT